MKNARRLVAGIALLSSAAIGCVPKGKYDAAIADSASAHAALSAALERGHALDEKVAALQHDLDDARAQAQSLDQKVSDLSTASHNLQAQLDEATALNAQLRGELQRLGKNVDQMLSEKGTLTKALDDAKGRLEELRKAQAAAEARAQLFQQFVQKFKSLVDAGQLKVVTRNGRLVLQLSNDVVFDSGQTAIKPVGKDALVQVGAVLKTLTGRTFQVAGHTDDVPIQTPRFPSNWELSTARAVAVVKLLIELGMEPKMLSAAGYGPFDPVASNDTNEGRAKNRRIEITLQPNLDELVAAPELH
jgi:chemotaxis protein MotB